MRIRYCHIQCQFVVLLPAEGTAFLFDTEEKELAIEVIKGMIDMAPDKADEFQAILDSMHERSTVQ